jgi:hypothetical protein
MEGFVKSWHEEVFGVCPHGMAARPYCGLCASEDADAEREQKRQVRDERRQASMQETIDRQSAALDDAYRHIHALRRRDRG